MVRKGFHHEDYSYMKNLILFIVFLSLMACANTAQEQSSSRDNGTAADKGDTDRGDFDPCNFSELPVCSE